jgi:SAM-dependent methyltransferase
MDIFEQALGNLSAGRVLDVATGQGGFVELLSDELADYKQIIGIDVSESMISHAPNTICGDAIYFIQMDAERLGFEDESFDTVTLSASLHHLADTTPTLAQMMRVLKPGGHLVVAEMHRDATTEAQLTSVKMHNWAAGLDLDAGVPHYPTLTRQRIIDLVEALDLTDISFYDQSSLDSDPMDEDRIRFLKDVLERYLHRAQELPNYTEIEAQAKTLRQRLRKVGAQSEPRIVIVGQKQ